MCFNNISRFWRSKWGENTENMDKWSSQVLNGSYQQVSQNMELNLDIEMNKVGEFTHFVE